MESNEAFIKFKEFQENFKNIKYENSIVGILDILGFKNEIENEDESSLRNLNQVILEKKFLNEELVDFKNINFFMLSDTFVVFLDDESIGSAKKVITVLSNIKRSLLHDGFLSRGCVVKGKHFLKNNILISPAFIKAYLIEEKECIYPRIIIEDELAKQILDSKEDTQIFFPSHFIEQDFDGNFIAKTFLQVREIAAFCDEKTREEAGKDDFESLNNSFEKQIELYKESIEKCINKINENDHHLAAKINYVINEYNQLLNICKFYPDREFLVSKHINFIGEKKW